MVLHNHQEETANFLQHTNHFPKYTLLIWIINPFTTEPPIPTHADPYPFNGSLVTSSSKEKRILLSVHAQTTEVDNLYQEQKVAFSAWLINGFMGSFGPF